jgi:putative membrane protein
VDPAVWAALFLAGWIYARAFRRLRGWPPGRTVCFFAGLGAAATALATPLATFAHDYFSVHMVQHLLLTVVAAPLVLLGAPGALLMRTASPAARLRYSAITRSLVARTLTHPVVSWSLFAAVMWASHFTGMYDAALGHAAVHIVEHVLYLSAGLLFWWPVVGIDPGAHRLVFPLRVAYLILMMPVQAFLGLAIYSADEVLYSHYQDTAGALADQEAAAVIMWVGGDLLVLGAVVAVVLAWMRHEDRLAAHIDRRLGVS